MKSRESDNNGEWMRERERTEIGLASNKLAKLAETRRKTRFIYEAATDCKEGAWFILKLGLWAIVYGYSSQSDSTCVHPPASLASPSLKAKTDEGKKLFNQEDRNKWILVW